MAKPHRLTDQQDAFVSYYIGEARNNATKAAALAGYKAPRQAGSHLLSIPAIRERIDEANAELRAEGLLNKHNRLKTYQELDEKLKAVMSARAKAYAPTASAESEGDAIIRRSFGMPGKSDVIGGDTGLVVRKETRTVGRNPTITVEDAVDTGTIQQILNVNKQAAVELGEWAEKRQVTGADEGPIDIKLAESATERLVALIVQDLAQEDGAGEEGGEG